MDRYMMWFAVVVLAMTVFIAEANHLAESPATAQSTDEEDKNALLVGANEIPPRAEEPTEVECIPQAPPAQKTVMVGEYTYQATINCVSASATLDPPAGDTSPAKECCEDMQCRQKKEIGKVLGGVGGTVIKDKKSPKYTITLNTIWDRKKVMYYKCVDGPKECVVTVKMPPPPAENKCILYKQIALKVSESNRSVNFICEQPGVLEPRKPIQYVYDGRRCAHVSELTSLLPCSRLEHKETPGGTLYTYTVDTFPLEPVKLCYVCIFPEPPDPRTPRLNYLRKVPCPLLIEVAATTATSTGKTNDSPTLVCGVSCFVGILPLGLVSTLGVY